MDSDDHCQLFQFSKSSTMWDLSASTVYIVLEKVLEFCQEYKNNCLHELNPKSCDQWLTCELLFIMNAKVDDAFWP